MPFHQRASQAPSVTSRPTLVGMMPPLTAAQRCRGMCRTPRPDRSVRPARAPSAAAKQVRILRHRRPPPRRRQRRSTGRTVTAGDADEGSASHRGAGTIRREFPTEELLRHLALEVDAVAAVSGHGVFDFRNLPPQSVLPSETVCLKGRTPRSGEDSSGIDTGSSTPGDEPVKLYFLYLPGGEAQAIPNAEFR